MDMLRRLRELGRFGYDVFISYSRSDGLRYAQALYVGLHNRGLAPFIDVVGTSPGQQTPASVLRRLRRSSMLVLVCSPGAAASKNIGEEVAAFAPTGRNIVVIDSHGALLTAIWKDHLGGLPVQAEIRDALTSGKPSDAVLDAVLSAADFVRRSNRLRRATIAAGSLAALLLGGSLLISAKIIADAAREARRAQIGTRLERDGSEAARVFASEQMDGLLAAMKSAGGLVALQGKDPSIALDLDDVPAISPMTALIDGVGRARLRNRLARYPDTFLQVAFSPNGRVVGALSRRGEDLIGLFDADSGRELSTLEADDHQLMSLSFHPGGDVVVTGGLGLLQLRAVATGKVLRTLSQDEDYFRDARFSPDGRLVAAAYRNSVRLWDVESGAEITPALTAESGVARVEFSPDGKTVAGAASNGVIALWQVGNAGPVRRLRGHQEQIESVVFAPDGTRLFSTALDGKVVAWNLETEIGEVLAAAGGYGSLTISRNGRFLAQSGSSSEAARVWDLEAPAGRKGVKTFPAPVGAVAFDASGQVLLVAYGDGRLAGYRVASWADGSGRGWKEVLAAQAHDRYFDVRFDPTGKRFATGGEDGRLNIWELTPAGIARVTPRAFEGSLFGTMVSPDSRYVAGVEDRNRAVVREFASGREAVSLRTQAPISQLRFSADSQVLLVTEGQPGAGTVTHLLDAASGKELSSSASSGDALAVFDADLRWRASYADGRIQVVELSSGRSVAAWPVKQPIAPYALSSDGKTLLLRAEPDKLRVIALGSNDEAVVDADRDDVVTLAPPHWLTITGRDGWSKLWNTKTRKLVAIDANLKRGLGHPTFSPDGAQIAYTDDASGVHVRDLVEDRELANLELPEFPVVGMTLSSGGRVLAIDRNGGAQIKLWDVPGHREIRTVSDAGDHYLSSDGRLLVTRSYQGDRVQLWQVSTGREIGTLFAAPDVAQVRLAPDGETLHGWSKDGDLLVWPMRLGKWRAAACAWSADYLRLHPGENAQTITTLDGKTSTVPLCDLGAASTSPRMTAK